MRTTASKREQTTLERKKNLMNFLSREIDNIVIQSDSGNSEFYWKIINSQQNVIRQNTAMMTEAIRSNRELREQVLTLKSNQ